jgi:hypothetical protein
MGVIIPQVVTSDRASGAQVIDGSLKFDSSKSTKLSRTPGSAGIEELGHGVVGLNGHLELDVSGNKFWNMHHSWKH